MTKDMCAATVLLLQGAWQELSTQYRGILLPGVQLPGGALQVVRAQISVLPSCFCSSVVTGSALYQKHKLTVHVLQCLLKVFVCAASS